MTSFSEHLTRRLRIPYALTDIRSHHEDFTGRRMSGEGFMNLEKLREKLFAHACRLVWSYACCIDSSEEAILAMFRWYRNAFVSNANEVLSE
ncbi:hypothetical protein DEU56DRAFT_857116, partial [Suillus clintonianus]|uniref:uncharacterized protein n=1 Tax=Suillus clintonianus TaxID=1904413 RepID=UPI001B87CD82